MTDIVQVLAGLGVVTAGLGFLKYSFERRRWRNFKRRASVWVNRQVELKEQHASKVNADAPSSDWISTVFDEGYLIVVVEEMLNDAGFTPMETQQLFGISQGIVRGMAAERYLV